MGFGLGLRGLGLGGRRGALDMSFAAQMRRLPGLFAYWPLAETSGVTADNAQGTAALDGTYSVTYTQANAAFPVGAAVVTLTGGKVVLPQDAVIPPMNWSIGWWLGWGKMDAATLTDGLARSWTYLRHNTQERLAVRSTTGVNYGLSVVLTTGNVAKSVNWTTARSQWTLLAATWHQAGDGLKVYQDGVLLATQAGLAAPLGGAAARNALIGAGDFGFLGGIGHHAVGAGVVLTEAQINALYESVLPDTREITFCGDSKSNNNDYWPTLLLEALGTATGTLWRERCGRLAEAGYRTAQVHALVDAQLPGRIGNPEAVLLNVGANDITGGTAEATFKAELAGIIDAYLAKFATTTVYVAYPYRDDNRNGSYDAAAATMKGWIDAVIGTYASRVLPGHDENVWFKGANIDTYSTDRIHPDTTAGQAECAAQWQAILGY